MLLRLGVTMVVLVVATAAGAWSAFTRLHETVPAIVEISAAHTALVEADLAAVESFRTGGARLAGSGEEYRNQMAIVSQNLAQAAEDNVADESGSQRLRLIEGLLAVYTSSIEQAVSSRQGGATALGTVELWQASRLLHTPSTGILHELTALRDEQRASGATNTLSHLFWLVPAILLFGLLVRTQVHLHRRFRRTTSPALLMATGCLLWLVAVTSLTFGTESRLERALDGPAARWRDQAAASVVRAGQELRKLLDGQCVVDAGHCGVTVSLWTQSMPRPDGAEGRQPSEEVRAISAEVAEAGERGRVAWQIPLSAAMAVGFVVVGLYPRVDEYRYGK